MNSIIKISHRCISTTASLAGKKNFTKFYLPNQRGTRAFREKQKTDPDPRYPLETYGVRDITIIDEFGKKVECAEKIPEFIVPDLNGFELKPYVSYRATPFTQNEFTPEDLFNAVYSQKIVDDWNSKQLNADGSPKNPSEDERLTPEEAEIRARKTGADIFGEKPRCTL